MNPFSRVKDGTLYPPFRKKLETMFKLLADKGYNYVITSGLRTHEEQLKLYAQGRTAPGKIVTTVKVSLHCFGVAADSAFDLEPDKAGLQPSWDSKYMKLMADAAKEVGLDPGYYWKTFKDGPHVQLNLKKHGLSIAKLQEVYETGGLAKVWEFLDTFEW